MLVAIAHCQKENAQVKQLAAWMAELGPYPNHRLLVGRDEKAEPNLFANSGFSSVEEITIIGDVWNKWVESCNNAYRQIAKHIEYGIKEPWLWLEPDAIPLCAGWVDKIEAEYQEALRNDKVFMGDLVHQSNIIDHMSGVAVYPGIMSDYAGDALLAHEIGWDVVGASQILPRMHKSKLILQRWKHPAFESWEQVEKSIFQVKPDCVLFHADKSHSLLPLLREHFANTEPRPVSTSLAVAKRVEASEGPERDGNKPLMRNRQPAMASPTGSTASDTFVSESASTATEALVDWVKFEQDATTAPKKESREAIVRDAVAVLKRLCTAPRYINQVRKELRAQGVIR